MSHMPDPEGGCSASCQACAVVEADDRALLSQLLAVLGREVGKTGESEGAIDVLERILRERDSAELGLGHVTVERDAALSSRTELQSVIEQACSVNTDFEVAPAAVILRQRMLAAWESVGLCMVMRAHLVATHRALDEARLELASARAAVGPGWFVGGCALSEAIRRKTRVLEGVDRSGRHEADSALRAAMAALVWVDENWTKPAADRGHGLPMIRAALSRVDAVFEAEERSATTSPGDAGTSPGDAGTEACSPGRPGPT